MDDRKEFLNKHGNSIKVILRDSKLSDGGLLQRINFLRKNFNNDFDNEILNKIEDKMTTIINTGKDKFSEDDIDVILHQILGLEVREYDKSHLVNLEDEEIVNVNAKPQENPVSYTVGNTTITQIGTLTYTDWVGVQDFAGLPYYKVDKKDEKGKVSTYKVFSHINMGALESDPDYRSAVLEVLLEEGNMTKTNCGGYIGSIQTVGEGIGLEDTVKANSKYSLVFDSTDATAVVKLRNMVKQTQEKTKNDEGR